jgi:plastocyanin domain-containing protein
MNKTSLLIITFGLIIGIGIIFGIESKTGSEITSIKPGQNVEMREGVQYVTISAKGGYFPRISSAQSNIPTKLVVKTNGTYDCSAALVIRSVGYQKVLPQTGEEVIDIGTSQAGSSVQGTCSMGMYNFVVNFI